MHKVTWAIVIVALGALAGILLGCPDKAIPTKAGAAVSGAIYTSLADGTIVNKNLYELDTDVYLNGGPGPHAPSSAAGLPEGWYYFQVTDPSGQKLLSTDPVKCRNFHVNAAGVIDQVGQASLLRRIRGTLVPVECSHATGIDQDHPEDGAITVQLYPFNKTPNKGGVYKVWATPQGCFQGDPELVDNPELQFHGFVPACSKTDNYKIKKNGPIPPRSVLSIVKVDDLNFNGIWDPGEPKIGYDCAETIDGGGWPIDVTDPLGVTNRCYTTCANGEDLTLFLDLVGTWTVCEGNVDHWKQTAVYVDGVLQPLSQCVDVPIPVLGEYHAVIFLNSDLGEITAYKGYDGNADGVDDGIPIEGFQLLLTGTDVTGAAVGPICALTDSTGTATWSHLVPGDYQVCEVLPLGSWVASTPTCVDVNLPLRDSPDDPPPSNDDAIFLNYCVTPGVAMHTKGWWQNPNGCEIIANHPEYLAFLNGLAPYASGTVYTNAATDNCTGGTCTDVVLPFDSNSELGCYIVAPNNQGDCLGLAQQLAAFVLNCLDQLDSRDGIILCPGAPQDMTTQEIIDAAIAAWESGVDCAYWQTVLDTLNNCGLVDYIEPNPCLPIVYPTLCD